MSLVASGSSRANPWTSGKNATVDLQPSQGPHFAAEVAHGVIGMTRKEVNPLASKLLERYESRIGPPARGKATRNVRI